MTINKMRCFGCGVEKDPNILEFYTQDDRLVKDEPIDPLFVLCAESRIPGIGWKHAVVCHVCFAKLDVDHWISSDCWKSINPMVAFQDLPEHTEESCGNDDPRLFAHIVVKVE